MTAPTRWRGERGFTLLESLVAMLILAVGLLGLAGLQTQGLRFNTDAYVRSQATFLAYDMIERMRIRRFNTADDATGEAAVKAYAVANPGTACTAEKFSSGATVDEVACWHATVATTLPGGSGTVARTSDGGTPGDPTDDLYQVTLTWVDRASNQDPPDNTVSQTWTFQP